jgi:hypothetical protein
MDQLDSYYNEFKEKNNKTQIGLIFCNGAADP